MGKSQDPLPLKRRIALLRGVNVGGKNRLPMQALAALCAAAGCGDVRTYIQSGNVVFSADDAAAERLPERLAAAIARAHGLRVPVVLRTVDELRAVARANPFLKAGADPVMLHVAFLADRPDRARAATLDPDRSPPDTFVVRGREIYLKYPNGSARSRLGTDYFDRQLGTVSTLRNWRTVLALLELATAPPSPAKR